MFLTGLLSTVEQAVEGDYTQVRTRDKKVKGWSEGQGEVKKQKSNEDGSARRRRGEL